MYVLLINYNLRFIFLPTNNTEVKLINKTKQIKEIFLLKKKSFSAAWDFL